ncbi:hypothetical protein ACHAPE_010479 [Trichoderma viride]
MRDEEVLPPSLRPRLKSRDHIGQDETAKHGRASHYTISRDETSLGSSGKDKLRALRKAEDGEQYQGQPDFHNESRESNNLRVSDSFAERSRAAVKKTIASVVTGAGRLDAATNALEFQHKIPESQPDSLVLFLQKKIKKLQSENEGLLNGQKRENNLDVNFEVLHHISSKAGTETYLEKPYWAKTNKEIQLKANSPILYPDAYIQYKSLEFIVERYYSRDQEAPEIIEALRQNQIPNPIPSVEHIRPVSNDMREAIKLLRKSEDPRNTPAVLQDGVMVGPYYWWYYYRDQPDIFDNLPRTQEKLVRDLTNWIDANYSDLYSRIDSQFERGMVSVASITFLIRPGGVLVHMDRDSAEAYLASSSLAI